MKIETALKIHEKIDEDRRSVRFKKAHDYASEDDCLKNFKATSAICKILNVDVQTPYGSAYYMKIHKIVRECQFIFGIRKGTNPQNESLYDTICIDGPNYHDLFIECLIEAGLLEVPDI